MGQVKLELAELNDADTIALGRAVRTAMLANAATFPAPSPGLPSMLINLNAADVTMSELDISRQDALTKTGLKDAAIQLVRDDLTMQGGYVQSVSNGDPTTIQLAGMAVRAAGAPAQMTQVLNLSTSNGDAEGSLDAQWDSQRNVRSFEVQSSPDPITPGSWVYRLTAPSSTATIPGLPIGTKVWVRVRAVGSNNTGAWSDPAVKMVS